MKVHEGRGFLLRTGQDGPWAGWISLRTLDRIVPVREAPWMALQAVAQAVGALPGGLALLWDAPAEWPESLNAETRQAFLGLLARLPGLTLHLRDPLCVEGLNGPLSAWFHAPEPPTGRAGQLWRQGWIGWIPDREGTWSLPGLAGVKVDEEGPAPGSLWGELVLPLGALAELTVDQVAPVMTDAQARLEWDFSQRLSARAWPEAFPFQRRRAGWRVALIGGREFETGRGVWQEAATRLQTLAEGLQEALRCPLWLGSSHDFALAARLGHQAMHEGLPWRTTLPMPPAPPHFSPGFGADPREPVSLEARAAFPAPMASQMTHPPVALLRTPHVPQENAVAALVRGMAHPPAIRWLPPDLPPPGPFMAERPWSHPGAFTPLADITQALQGRLFDDE